MHNPYVKEFFFTTVPKPRSRNIQSGIVSSINDSK